MTHTINRIGILTSGGDCAGLNAVIYAVVKSATRRGWTVYGLPNGTDGFIDLARGICQPHELEISEHTFDIPGQKGMNTLLFLSGSVLGCRGKKKTLPSEKEEILEGYRRLNLDALIAVGGDGSLEILNNLAQEGVWPLIAIPKTIDNDVPCTEQVVGFDTAVDTVTTALYNLTFTAASHDRVMIVQVMGRDAGHLALHAGMAGGAEVILIPELTPQLSQAVLSRICHKIAQIRLYKRKFVLMIVAEGVKDSQGNKEKNIAQYLMKQLQEYGHQHCHPERNDFCGLTDASEIEMRVTDLGHLPRSSPPSSLDRLMAVRFGIKAIDLIVEEKFGQMVVWKNGDVGSLPLSEVIEIMQAEKQQKGLSCASPVAPNSSIVHTARLLGICLGDQD